MIILSAPFPSINTQIYLPDPQFSDSQAIVGKIKNIYMTMDGDTFTYVANPNTNKITYEFELTVDKALELEAFLDLFINAVIRLINQLGEIWIVQIVDEPTFNNIEKGDYQKVSINFEGKLNA